MARIKKNKKTSPPTDIVRGVYTRPQDQNIGSQSPIISRKNIILILILLAIVLVWKFKGYFIAATVNGQPISRVELNDQLEKKFGSQVLDNIINERLILSATRQKGIFVTDEEINGKIKEIEGRLNGKISMDDALKAQGLTKDDLKRQIEIQLSIEKMFVQESTVSAAETDSYIKENSQAYKSATDPAQVKVEVQNILHQQKLSESFDTWFSEIKKGAKIQKYI